MIHVRWNCVSCVDRKEFRVLIKKYFMKENHVRRPKTRWINSVTNLLHSLNKWFHIFGVTIRAQLTLNFLDVLIIDTVHSLVMGYKRL